MIFSPFHSFPLSLALTFVTWIFSFLVSFLYCRQFWRLLLLSNKNMAYFSLLTCSLGKRATSVSRGWSYGPFKYPEKVSGWKSYKWRTYHLIQTGRKNLRFQSASSRASSKMNMGSFVHQPLSMVFINLLKSTVLVMILHLVMQSHRFMGQVFQFSNIYIRKYPQDCLSS